MHLLIAVAGFIHLPAFVKRAMLHGDIFGSPLSKDGLICLHAPSNDIVVDELLTLSRRGIAFQS